MNNFRVILVVFCLFFTSNCVFASQRTVKIGSGSILKGYYSIGLDLCKTFTLADKSVNCEVVPTSGGVENLALLKEGKIDLALVQSNVALEAFEGTGYYSNTEKMQEMRQVLNLYDEFFTVVVKNQDEIKTFSDIEGKRISNGLPFSSNTITYNAIRKLYNFTKEPIDVDEINYKESIKEFCSGKIDVIMMTVGHPNALMGFTANSCKVDFVPIEDNKTAQLIATNKAFHKALLDKRLYPGITLDQNTVAVTAILVTNSNMDSKLLDKFIGMFHKNVKHFKHSNYMLYNIDIEHFADTNNFVLPKHSVVRNR
ncbi:TAXI family TRAP transporter solute-binding subunit [Candidatus Tisiphia endosymbiont of Piscicola geometra]|uniref:TAXI family TRAP transporter solute-binding subunit n=1 Tax=Candidatus Tisiphia endosymbiont of Piscicola geometra TaxID=3066273 RepID=UPI00312C6FBD